jgi:hypothetical protein
MALSVGVNEAVATAVQEAEGQAVREAVQAVLKKVLTSPDLLAVLRYVGPNALWAGLVARAEAWRWVARWRRPNGDAAPRSLASL